MTIFLPMFITIICIFFKIHCVFSLSHDALAIISNYPSPPGVDLPFKATESNGQIEYPDITIGNIKLEYSYLCSPQTPEGKEDVIKLSEKINPELAFCLEDNPSTEQPTKCPEEVEPALTKHTDSQKNKIQCGKSSNQIWYNFGFSYMRLIKDPEVEKLSKRRRRVMAMGLYEICFNTQKSKMLWTKHKITTGLMLKEPGLPSQQIHPPYEFSTEHFALPKNTFLKIPEEYENQETNAHYKMIPQMLVPQEDLALRIWKKTTTHYVNTAPLWENLGPLMKAINDGIRKAGIIVNVKTYQSNIHKSDAVYIYTLVNSYVYRLHLDDLVESADYFSKNLNRFGLNVWCKFIHNETKNTGVMIYLHNLPDLPPIKIDSASNESEPKLILESTECETIIPCNFRKWADDPEGLSDDLVNYAYCCEVNNEIVDEFFSIKLNDELKLFDIDRIINEGFIESK